MLTEVVVFINIIALYVMLMFPQVIFYTVMFLENSLLIGVWVAGVNRSDLLPHQHNPRPVTIVLGLLALFFGGMFFMGLYYR